MDIENSISMDLGIVENFLQEPKLYSKKLTKKVDWHVIQKMKLDALEESPLKKWKHPILNYVPIASLDYAKLGMLMILLFFFPFDIIFELTGSRGRYKEK